MGRLSKYGGTSGATLTVTTTEALTINGKDYGGSASTTIANVRNVVRRIETITTTEATICTFGDDIAGGTYNDDKVKYMRFTNIDDTNHIVLTFATENSHEFAIKVDAGCSLSIFGDVIDTGTTGGMKSMFDASASALTVALEKLVSITADADTGNCDMEIYIAMI
tara:strand:+ start:55 stop:552 length:498 start_codon:yes stop_codon:yes gene_type:complete